jgi:outer membrane protein
VASMQQQIVSEVRQGALNVQLAEERIHIIAASLRAAEEGLAAVQERYRLGRASVVELSEAEALFASTQANYIHAIYTHKIAVAQLERALGRKLER